MLEACKKYNEGEELTIEEIKAIAYGNILDLSYEEEQYCSETFSRIMKEHGKPWSDSDVCTPFHEGYELDGEIFITGYSGVAGKYWSASICTTC